MLMEIKLVLEYTDLGVLGKYVDKNGKVLCKKMHNVPNKQTVDFLKRIEAKGYHVLDIK